MLELSSIKRLEEQNYIRTAIVGGGTRFGFRRNIPWLMLPAGFLNTSFDPKMKGYLISLRRFMFVKIPGYGAVKYSFQEVAERMNISERTVLRFQKKLDYYMVSFEIKRLDKYKNFVQMKIYDLKKIRLV